MVTLGASAAILVTAGWLRPSGEGFGTHTQLGLAPCGFKQATGLPCATCGMTTAFSNAAHGNLLDSLLGQPAGFLLVILTCLLLWAGLMMSLLGTPAKAFLPRAIRKPFVFGILGFVLISWGYTMLLHQ